jgi:mannose-6-phosphate isomerase-like protein (cupin superfamily)
MPGQDAPGWRQTRRAKAGQRRALHLRSVPLGCDDVATLAARYSVNEGGGRTMSAEMKKAEAAYGRFDVKKIAESFPPTADTLLLDTYLTNEQAASSRVFRVYRPTPAHYHATCDEYLYVLSGRGSFWLESPHNIGAFEPGQLLFFRKGVVHALPDMYEEPIIFLSVDTPRRDPKDIIFVNPEDGTPDTFIKGV